MKRMMLYIDGSPNDRDSLAYAVGLHDKLGGRLDVAHLRIPEHTVGSVARAIDVAQRAVSLAHQSFVAACGGREGCGWIETDETFENTLRHQGRLHDLTILERISEEQGPEVLALNTALFDSGGPVLVLTARPPASVADHAAVVWSPTAQAARALRSAIPVLQHASGVTLLTNSETANSHVDEVVLYLADHGIKADHRTFDGAKRTARGRGRAILAAVKEIEADFLVIGGYGENRLESLLGLGRTTRKIVIDSSVPVFLQR